MQAMCAALRQHCSIDEVCIKLQCVHGTACPRVHVDHVRVRALCTYLGPGTQFVPSEACAVRSDEVLAYAQKRALSAEAGDLVFLKGVEDGMGPAAAHRSPVYAGARLLLTVDTAVDSAQYFLAG